jgi:uncharacterized protein (UPF0276 family)
VGYRERHRIPDLGVGVGFRPPHAQQVLGEHPAMDWFEIISENFFAEGGPPRANVEALRDAYRVVPHGVSLSIGSTDPLDRAYLAKLKSLARRVGAPWCSDHFCWTGVGQIDVHDLLPLPYMGEAVDHVVDRVKAVQDFLEVPFALENASTYLAYRESTMPEWEFVAEVAERADCGLLFDVNNVFVSAKNHGFDPNTYVDAIPADRVVQIHLAGHTDKGTYLLDTHSDHVRSEVWELYQRALRRIGATSTLIEWDQDIPTWDVLAAEASIARCVRDQTLGARASAASVATGSP